MVKVDERPLPGMGRLFAALALMQEGVRERVEVQTMMGFVAVAAQPGIHMREVERMLGASSATASRTISGIAGHERERGGKPGPKLVEAFEDPQDRRYKVVYLTDKGRRLAEHIATTLYGDGGPYGEAA